jgi:hypothetical protein
LQEALALLPSLFEIAQPNFSDVNGTAFGSQMSREMFNACFRGRSVPQAPLRKFALVSRSISDSYSDLAGAPSIMVKTLSSGAVAREIVRMPVLHMISTKF